MPRLGLSISENFDHRPKAPKPDRYGRRVRAVDGVRVVGEREVRLAFTTLYAKIFVTLALLAALTSSLAILRLFTFRH